jgi:hypothetical protein
MKELTLKYDQNLHKNIRFGPANFQRQFIETRFLERLSGPEKQNYKEHLESIETVFKNESKFNSQVQSQSSQQNLPSQTQCSKVDINEISSTFLQRATKNTLLFDKEMQKKYANILDYGNVQGEARLTSDDDRFNKTYNGKQVNFEYDIRKVCGQVKNFSGEIRRPYFSCLW